MTDYFEKTFDEYKTGFASQGEIWLGLEAVHKITTIGTYSLRITLKDFDEKTYVAVYDKFQVGPEEGQYVLTVEGFNDVLSTLGDSFENPSTLRYKQNGMKFSTKDRDNDNSGDHCAQKYGHGWWYNDCFSAKLTGQVFKTQTTSSRGIQYFEGGERGNSWDNWKEAEMLLVPK